MTYTTDARAIKTYKGVALTLDEDGTIHVVKFGGVEPHICSASPSETASWNFGSDRQMNERNCACAKGINDAATLRAQTEEAYARNARIAQATKEASDKLWKRSAKP